MGRPHFLSETDELQLVDAIREAEQGNRGEVLLHIERRCRGDALARARALFQARPISRTSGDTGVLLYVAPQSRKAAVWAGSGIHGSRDPGFWQRVIDEVAGGFYRGEPTPGLVAAIHEIGEVLREVVPGDDVAGNEVADEVTTS